MEQAQVTKPKRRMQLGTKSETIVTSAPKAAPTKAVVKKVAKTVEPVALSTRRAAKGQIVYPLMMSMRPTAGGLLFAHTHAALTVLGMFEFARPSVPKSSLLTLVGERAVSWHTGKGNLESAPDQHIRLSQLGYNSFKGRYMDGKINILAANEYVNLFLDAAPGKITGVSKARTFQTVL